MQDYDPIDWSKKTEEQKRANLKCYMSRLDKLTQEDIYCLEDLLLDLLPSGSGIDCSWEIEIYPSKGRVECKNFYHNMNDDGYCDGYSGFTVKIYKNCTVIVKGISNFPDRYRGTFDYIWEIIMYNLGMGYSTAVKGN